MNFLPYARQVLDKDDIAAVAEVLASDYLTTGPMVNRLEKAFANYTRAHHAVVCANGTAALHLCALSCGIGEGDQVIVPSVTFVATANASRYVGAEVIFADVDPETGLMTLDSFNEALSRCEPARLKAVFPVHLGGRVCDLQALSRALKQTAPHAVLIEDACHALGGSENPEQSEALKVGACGHSVAAVFSLHPAKIITMGEGGIICTNDGNLAWKMRLLRNHGLTREPGEFTIHDQAFANNSDEPNPWYYELTDLGFNYRATDIQCALGLSQLSKLDHYVEERARLVALYDDALASITKHIKPMGGIRTGRQGWHLYTARIDFSKCDRNYIMRSLQERGIGSQVHYIPVHHQPYYKNLGRQTELTGADHYYAHTLSLPLYPGLDEMDVGRVTAALGELLS